MDMQKMEQSQNAMNRLNSAVEELIKIVQQQKIEFNTRIIEQKNLLQAAENKVAVLEAQSKTLDDENQKLKIELITARNNTENEDKIKSLQNEAEAKTNKISGLQTEVQNLNTALSNRKTQIEELHNKNNDLTEKLAIAEAKIKELESSAASENNAASELQIRLDDALAQNEELKRLQQESSERVLQMQQTISQTTDSIDDVVTKLEKVLEENGASYNND